MACGLTAGNEKLTVFNHKFNDKSKIFWYTDLGNNTERKKIMRNIGSAFIYTNTWKASFASKGGFAKHTHFQDKQNRYSMIPRGEPGIICLNDRSRLSCE
jgi:hypothetical protein